MRSVGMLVAGIVLGVLLILGWFQLSRTFGQGVTGPMGTMMGQMMGPQNMAGMMAQMMHDQRFMESMASACAQSMKDPAVLRSMREAMDNPQMRQLMEQMLNMMERR